MLLGDFCGCLPGFLWGWSGQGWGCCCAPHSLTTPCLCTAIQKAEFVVDVDGFYMNIKFQGRKFLPFLFCKNTKSCLSWFKRVWLISRHALLLSLLPNVGTAGPSWAWRVPKSPNPNHLPVSPCQSHKSCAQPLCPITGSWIQCPGCTSQSPKAWEEDAGGCA